ncbi:MAG: hypothetical protein HY673_09500 [Chloroflexi bacterium]|nr:hypothetical protein [Chloroflexota bacterium]
MNAFPRITFYVVVVILALLVVFACRKPDEPTPPEASGGAGAPGSPPGQGMSSGTVSLSPAAGLAGTNVAVTGSGFGANIFGGVFFDANANGVYDPGEPMQYVTTSPNGGFNSTLAVPASAKPGPYPVRAGFAFSASQSTASFTVTSAAVPVLVLTPASGSPGSTISVTGSGFAPNIYGAVLFDTNGNGNYDQGEPLQPVTTSANGTFTTNLIAPVAPAAKPGAYTIKTSFSFSAVQASATFAVTTAAGSGPPPVGGPTPTTLSTPPTQAGTPVPPATTPTRSPTPRAIPTPSQAIALNPTIGRAGTTVTVTGSGFTPNTLGGVFLDLNRSGSFDSGEPFQSGTTSGSGTVTLMLALPASLSPGAHYVMAAFPLGNVQASALFTLAQ